MLTYAQTKTGSVHDRFLIKTLESLSQKACRQAQTLYPHLGEQIWWANVLKDVSPQEGAEAILKLLVEEGVLR